MKRTDFNRNNQSESYYDLVDDLELIEASFLQQYGIRLRVAKEEDISYSEFLSLLSGINGDTPLGNVVRIRSEKDLRKIKNFSEQERRIYYDYRFKQAELRKNNPALQERYVNGIQNMLKSVFMKGG